MPTLSTQGFTLLELVLVIVIMGILSINALPKFSNLSVFQSRTFGDEVLNSIRYGQKLAVGMGCDLQVSSNGTNLTLNLRANCTGSGAFNVNVRHPGSGSSSYVIQAPTGISIVSSDLPIYFDAGGRSRNSSSNAVQNSTVTVAGRTINIVGETGFTYEP